MIIDSHAHYCHRRYDGEFPYLDRRDGSFCLSRAHRKDLLEAMAQAGICLCIEPATSLEKIEDQLSLAAEYSPHFHLAFGVHPKKCVQTPWKDRKKLDEYVRNNNIVAIGETGLDYSLPPQDQKKLRQKVWFCHQIRLAHKHNLPLILHIRDADRDALKILNRHKKRLHGGVAHCFGGDYETAMAYIDLGFALGIGGRLLHDDEQGLILQDAVKRVPLTAILVETDAPYILPDIRDLPYSGKQRKKMRNTSLILPAVIEKIAQLRRENVATVEKAIYQNTVRVFGLDGR